MDEINNRERIFNIDLLKVVATVCMILCHIVIRLASHRDNYENEMGYIFGDLILGSYMGVAHAFMFAMGVGVIFSKNQKPT